MKDLLYKEFKLSVHPSTYMFWAFGALLLIPSWPFFIAFGYLFMGIMNTFFVGRANQDLFFTASLPVRKKDVVFSRIFSMALCEIVMVAVAVPFAIIHNMLFKENTGGMNLNFAFFGFVLIMYAVFNGVFFPLFYKNGYKSGIPILLGIILSSVFAIAVEFAVHAVPVLSTNLNALGTAHMEYQLSVLAAGIAIYILITWLAGRKAQANFEKVDL